MSNHNIDPEIGKATRFPVNRPEAPNAGNTGPRLTTILKKLLSADWEVNDPKVQALIQKCGLDRTIEVILCLRRILNGTEGDDTAIERIFDRIDGKVTQKSEIEHSGTINIMPLIEKDGKPLEHNVGTKVA